jgi:hypothetical protein
LGRVQADKIFKWGFEEECGRYISRLEKQKEQLLANEGSREVLLGPFRHFTLLCLLCASDL